MTPYLSSFGLAVSRAIVELARQLGFYWDVISGRYKSKKTGRFVSASRVLSSMENYAQTAVLPTIENITQRFIDGDMTLERWQVAMIKEIKDSNIISSTAGRGGRKQMTQSDWGRTGARIRWQSSYLDKFASDIAAGNKTPAQIMAQAKMYARLTRTAFHDGLTSAKKAGGFIYEQRFLQPGETCPDCEAYARMGKVSIGTLPEPGQGSQCLSNCNCVKEYYKE